MVLLLAACAPHVASPSTPFTTTGANPLLLWEVSRNGHTSHILGTCHVQIPLDYALPDANARFLDNARVVITEADIGMEPTAAMGLIVGDGHLADAVGAPAWAQFTSRNPAMPAPMLDRMHPWAAAVTVSLAGMMPDAERGPAVEPMDRSIQKRAEARKIPQKHVESVEEQATLLATQDEMFLSGMRTPPDPAQEAESVRQLDLVCRTGHIGTDDPSFGGDRAFKEAFFDARNRAWIPKLVPELDQGGAFVAVGAGHLVGPTGVIQLLEQEGFTVRQAYTDRPIMTEAAFTPQAPLPAYDAARAERIRARLTPLVQAVCQEQSLVRACLVPDEATCVATIERDVGLCADQNSTIWEDSGPVSPMEAQHVIFCASAGAVLDGIGHGRIGDAPMCKVLKQSTAGGG